VEYREIIFTKEDGVATITLNRPEKLNAYGSKMHLELAAAVADIKGDRGIRAVILTGAGRGFCAGHDLKEIADARPSSGARNGERPTLGEYPPLLFRSVEVPLIAAINGIATGGGFALALICDIRIASESARFAELHVMRGMVPGAEAWLLPRAISTSKALELIFTADTIGAREAERLGLVSKVVPDGELMAAAREVATRIAKMPPLALKLAKRAVYHGLDSSFDTSLEYVAFARFVAAQAGETDEGIKAFVEKKPE